MTTMNFRIEGNFISDHIRNLFEEGAIAKSWNTFSTITEDENIYRDLIKGRKTFEGTNEFELVTCKKPDLVEKTINQMANYLASEKEYWDKVSTQYHSPIQYDELEEDMTLEDFIDYKKTNYESQKKKIKQLEEDFTTLQKLFNLTDEDIVLACLSSKASTDLSHPYGWITEKGWFLPVDFEGHDRFIYEFNDKMKTSFSVENIEKRWVRITGSGKIVLISACNFTLKPKQALTLEKWMLQNNVLEDGKTFSMFGYGVAEREGNRIKFTRHSKD